MNIRPLLGFLDDLDARLSKIGDFCALIGMIILTGLILCGIGYAFWYGIASVIFDTGARIQFAFIVLVMSFFEGFRPGMRWLRKRLESKTGAA